MRPPIRRSKIIRRPGNAFAEPRVFTGVVRGQRWQPDEAFDSFVAARMGALLSFAHLLTGDRAAAEDVVQTALARTAVAWRGVRDKESPEAYVRRAIVRTQLNAWRARRWRETPYADVPDRAAYDDEAARSDDRDAMWSALRTLPPRQRAVLVLRYYEGLSETEIAATLGCAAGTVKSQAAKGLARLRQQFAEREDINR
ncbi:MAG: SigE family RNA polymerase sigma factor [Actinomycetota bacterium]